MKNILMVLGFSILTNTNLVAAESVIGQYHCTSLAVLSDGSEDVANKEKDLGAVLSSENLSSIKLEEELTGDDFLEIDFDGTLRIENFFANPNSIPPQMLMMGPEVAFLRLTFMKGERVYKTTAAASLYGYLWSSLDIDDGEISSLAVGCGLYKAPN